MSQKGSSWGIWRWSCHTPFISTYKPRWGKPGQVQQKGTLRGWSYLPSLCPARLQALTAGRVVEQAPEERARGRSWALHSFEPQFKRGLVQSSSSEAISGKRRLLLPENLRTGKKERQREWGKGGERKEQRKKKEKWGRVKKREGPSNVTSPALWNGFSLMLTTWYLLSI